MSASYFQYRCYNDHPFIKEKVEDLFQLYQAGRRRKHKDKHDKWAAAHCVTSVCHFQPKQVRVRR